MAMSVQAKHTAAVEQEEKELETLITDFRSEYGLNENNFSLCCRDMTTGVEYRFNDHAFFFAASTYKLPLNLYYYELEQEGTLSPSSTVGGMSLSNAHYQSLVWSNNDVSQSMIYNLGNFRTYKEKMRKYFTMKDEEIDSSYYTGNYYCTSMMLDALRYLYERREDFQEQLEYMKQAQPGQYFKLYAGDTEIAHKYGYYYNAQKNVESINDAGILYTPHPFLLAVYTQNAGNGTEVLGRVCERLIQYSGEKHVEPDPEPVPAPWPDASLKLKPDPVPEAEPDQVLVQEISAKPIPVPVETPPENPDEGPEEIARRNIWWMILVAAFIFLLADVGAIFWMRRGGLERMEEKWGDEEDEEEETASS